VCGPQEDVVQSDVDKLDRVTFVLAGSVGLYSWECGSSVACWGVFFLLCLFFVVVSSPCTTACTSCQHPATPLANSFA